MHCYIILIFDRFLSILQLLPAVSRHSQLLAELFKIVSCWLQFALHRFLSVRIAATNSRLARSRNKAGPPSPLSSVRRLSLKPPSAMQFAGRRRRRSGRGSGGRRQQKLSSPGQWKLSRRFDVHCSREWLFCACVHCATSGVWESGAGAAAGWPRRLTSHPRPILTAGPVQAAAGSSRPLGADVQVCVEWWQGWWCVKL